MTNYSNHLHQVWCCLRLADVRCYMRPILQIDADLPLHATDTSLCALRLSSIYQHSILTEIAKIHQLAIFQVLERPLTVAAVARLHAIGAHYHLANLEACHKHVD